MSTIFDTQIQQNAWRPPPQDVLNSQLNTRPVAEMKNAILALSRGISNTPADLKSVFEIITNPLKENEYYDPIKHTHNYDDALSKLSADLIEFNDARKVDEALSDGIVSSEEAKHLRLFEPCLNPCPTALIF